MELKKGYKLTEVGVIPKDWEVKMLGEIGTLYKGKGIKKSEVVEDGIPCIRYGELYTVHHNQIHAAKSFITPETAKASQRISMGDVLFAGSGETKEEIGKSAVYLGAEPAYAGGDIICFSPYFANSLLLGFLLNDPVVAKQKAQFGQGDAVVHIYPNSLKKLNIPFPPTLAEQTAIASVISETDALIEKLEALIEKKKAIKQGAMQELLRPKKGWDKVCLKEIAEVKKGDQLSKSKFNDGGLYPVMNGGVSHSGMTDEYNSPKHTIIISEGGNSCGFVNYMKVPFWQGGHCYSLFTKLHSTFLFQLLKYYEPKLMALRVGSGLPNIQRSSLEQFEMEIPDEKLQTEIATILSDMDFEIETLEAKLSKYKLVKLGMMQELLTGKTRLI